MTDAYSRKTSFRKSVGLLALSVMLVLSVRWILFEPFVIPSGSMIPTLMIYDHILVTKFSFGVRLPFSSVWLVSPRVPERGDVVVFRSAERDNYFMIKRVVGLPGDMIKFTEQGELFVNGQPVPAASAEFDREWTNDDLGGTPDQFDLRREKLGEHDHFTLYEKSSFRFHENGKAVEPGKIFLMGDNRDRSRDSRFWGELPIENLIGRAQFVWLSCSKVVTPGTFLCDPRHIRWHRLFHRIE